MGSEMCIRDRKQAMTQNPKSNDDQARKAAKQVEKRQEYVEKTFGKLLDKGWRFVRIVALYDNHGPLVRNQCPHCSPFILTNGCEKDEEEQMKTLMSVLNQNPRELVSQSHTAHQNFRHLFSRIVGFSSLFMMVQRVDPYNNIMGTDATSITSGWTSTSRLKFGNENDLSRYGDMAGRPHDFYTLIFFSQDQIGLLSMKKKCVILLSDYGSGRKLTIIES